MASTPNGAWQTVTSENSGLSADHVTDIAEDAAGNLWFATYGRGTVPAARRRPGLAGLSGGRWRAHQRLRGAGHRGRGGARLGGVRRAQGGRYRWLLEAIQPFEPPLEDVTIHHPHRIPLRRVGRCPGPQIRYAHHAYRAHPPN